jgi:hypothetical protein
MGWISRFRRSGEAEPTAPLDGAIVGGAPCDAHKVIRSNPRNAAAPSERRDGQITEEIKRRQLSLAVRYVAAVRAR